MKRIVTASVLLALGIGSQAAAQGPTADWRTLETEHFRVHYPEPYEAWTLRAAAQLEAIRERVVEEVGYRPGEVTDVLVMDPVSRANGMALPFLGWPRMILWTTPPDSDSIIGHYSDWGELLLVHEDTHLVHLLRPSRNPWQRTLERFLLPVGPVTRQAPRWAIEGYATVLEGELTGAGRPNSDFRAAILRRWAQEGQLPSYPRLARDRERWLGMSMAYLMGSAYLEWLQERAGPDSLRHLWARLTAREARSFEQAFEGVFGDRPDRLYDRFRAELTYRAMVAEREIEPVAREGELWQHLEWTTSPPAVSPDGGKITLVLRDRKRPARLVVWSTEPDAEAEEKWQERIDEMLELDPEDVAPVRPRPLPRKALYELPAVNGVEPEMPRWMPDGESILFVRFEPDGEGFLLPDLFLWHLESGSKRRVTRGGRLRHPDPAPDGAWAVAVQSKYGHSQLVQVDLETGIVGGLTAPALDTVYDRPRLSPDGRRLAYLRHRDGRWRLVVRDLVSGDEEVLPTPDGSFLSHPAWRHAGDVLYAAVGRGGLVDIEALPVGPEASWHQVTRSLGGTFAPAPTPDGKGLFFLALQPHGFELRHLDLDAATVQLPELELPAELAPAAPAAEPPARVAFERREPEPGRPYGAGRQELRFLPGGSAGPSAAAFELGVRGGDLLGRTSYLGVVSVAESRRGPQGGALAGTWRRWPVAFTGRAFWVEELPSGQPREAPGLGRALDLERLGIGLEASWSRLWSPLALDLTLGGLAEEVEPALEEESLSRRVGFADVGGELRLSRDRWRWGVELGVRWESGRTGDDSWDLAAGRAALRLEYEETSLGLSWQRRSVDGAVRAFDRLQLGGLPSSLLEVRPLGNRILVPALPVGTRVGDEHEARRVDLRLHGLPPLFYEEHRVWPAGGERGEALALVGTELALTTGPLALVRLPRVDLRAGGARILDEPFKGRTRFWLSLAWLP